MALSDVELAKVGVKREDIASYAFRRYMHIWLFAKLVDDSQLLLVGSFLMPVQIDQQVPIRALKSFESDYTPGSVGVKNDKDLQITCCCPNSG